METDESGVLGVCEDCGGNVVAKCQENDCSNHAKYEGWYCRGTMMRNGWKVCEDHKHVLGPKKK